MQFIYTEFEVTLIIVNMHRNLFAKQLQGSMLVHGCNQNGICRHRLVSAETRRKLGNQLKLCVTAFLQAVLSIPLYS